MQFVFRYLDKDGEALRADHVDAYVVPFVQPVMREVVVEHLDALPEAERRKVVRVAVYSLWSEININRSANR